MLSLSGRAMAAVVVLISGGACSRPGATVEAAPPAAVSAAPSAHVDSAAGTFGALETEFGARLGVFGLDVASGRRVEHRADERFAYCSTFKALAVGDTTTAPARNEPGLNTAEPGDERDTSTPRALAESLRKYVLGDVLPESGRARLVEWLSGNATGDTLIRAGVPAGWTVADKSGGCAYGTRNDIAVVWPEPDRPVVLAVLSTRSGAGAEYDDALVARAAGAAVEGLA